MGVGEMYSPGYAGYGGYGGYGGGLQLYRSQPSQYFGQSYSYRNSERSYNLTSPSVSRRTTVPTRGLSIPPAQSAPPTRGLSVVPGGLTSRSIRQRTVARLTAGEESENRNLRLRSPSIPRETTRDELIDSIVHTRTREHRPLPGFKSASDYDERRHLRIDCDKVYDGIILGNGDTICNINYLKGIGVTHVLNTAERHVEVNPAKYPCYGIKYYGFHVDDLPESNISRYFPTTTSFIESAVSSGGLVVVNCVMGWSRSASVVAAYLVMKHKMKATKALELIRQNRNIRPNAGFLQQLADLENTLLKREHW